MSEEKVWHHYKCQVPHPNRGCPQEKQGSELAAPNCSVDEMTQVVALHLMAAQMAHLEQTWHRVDDTLCLLTGEIIRAQDVEGYEAFKSTSIERYLHEPFFKMRVDRLVNAILSLNPPSPMPPDPPPQPDPDQGKVPLPG